MHKDRHIIKFDRLKVSSDSEQTGSDIDGYDGYEQYSELYDFLEKHDLIDELFIPLIENSIVTIEHLKTLLKSKKTKDELIGE